MIAAPVVCFGYQNRGAECPTPHAIAYVSRCEQVACAHCVEESVAQHAAVGPFIATCHGCGTKLTSVAELQAHWRPVAGAA